MRASEDTVREQLCRHFDPTCDEVLLLEVFGAVASSVLGKV